jgi:Suppressor of fused protein (SUFU)
VTDVLLEVRTGLREHFAGLGITAEPDVASVTFLGVESIDVLRFGPEGFGSGKDAVLHYVSVGCSRHPMDDPTEMVHDDTGPRAEVTISLRGSTPSGLVQSIAVLAASPAIEGVVLLPDGLIDLESPLWTGAPFTALLLGVSGIADIHLPQPLSAVTVLSATPITATEAAWVRLKGADALREAWRVDGVDVLNPTRRASQSS